MYHIVSSAFKGGEKPTSKVQSPVEDTFKAIGKSINEDAVKSVQGIYQFVLSGRKFYLLSLSSCKRKPGCETGGKRNNGG